MSVIVCSKKEAIELMGHMDDNDMVILNVMNKKTLSHIPTQNIRKQKGEDLIKQAEDILYQDNDFFGRISLYGILNNKDIIHSILFPQVE